MKALIVVDIQRGLTEKKSLYHEKIFLDTVNKAIKVYRDPDSKIIFIQHNNNQLKMGTSDWEIDARINRLDVDIMIQKHHGNAFQQTSLKKILSEHQVSSVMICGIVSHGCVKATCLGGLAEGFETSLLKNGHTNWNHDAQIKIVETERELSEQGVIIQEVHINTD